MTNAIRKSLVSFADVSSYVAAVEGWGPDADWVPIVGDGAAPGFPAGIDRRSADGVTLDGNAPQIEVTANRVVLAVDEPACRAGARLLARASGRQLEIATAEDWDRQLAALLELDLRSLTLVAPAWTPRGEASPEWLARVLISMRARHDRVGSLAWGLLIATDPDTLSRSIAKAILQTEILTEYANASALVFTTGTAAGSWIHLPAYDPHAQAQPPIAYVDNSHILAKSAASVVDKRWSCLFFKGHGRAYCACQGHLCGARPLSVAPTAALSGCLLGMDCASPRDDAYQLGFPAFPRIDPRRYDTPVMVMDCCGTGNWAFPSWAQGIPSVSFHAIAGAASAVITGDQVTMTRSGSYADVLWALGSSATLGEAVVRLNGTRPEATAEQPYFLIGDPELVGGSSRWPSWSRAAELSVGGAAFASAGDTPFVRVSLPSAARIEAPATAFLECEGLELRAPRLFTSSRGAELWLNVGPELASRERAELTIDHRASVAVPPGVLRSVAALDGRLRSWSDNLRNQSKPLRAAGERIVTLATKLRDLEQRAVIGRAGDFEVALELALQSWGSAHAAILSAAVQTYSAGGLWPYRMWSVGGFVGEISPLSCPNCGVAPTLLRRYTALPASAREQWECVQCTLIQDRPAAAASENLAIRFRMPKQIRVGETASAELELDNREGSSVRIGAAIVQVDMLGHGVLARPSTPVELTIAPGQRSVASFELSLPNPPPIAHLYWARALALLDGEWFLASRPVEVG